MIFKLLEAFFSVFKFTLLYDWCRSVSERMMDDIITNNIKGVHTYHENFMVIGEMIKEDDENFGRVQYWITLLYKQWQMSSRSDIHVLVWIHNRNQFTLKVGDNWNVMLIIWY